MTDALVTREQLAGRGAQLNLLVDFEGEVGLLPTLPACANARLQRHALHVL